MDDKHLSTAKENINNFKKQITYYNINIKNLESKSN